MSSRYRTRSRRLISDKDALRALAGHQHERELAPLFDRRAHSRPGWRRERFENSILRFTALSLPEGVLPDDTRLLQDRSPTALDGVVLHETLRRLVTAIAALPPTMRAVLRTSSATLAQAGAAAGLRSERTAQRRRADAIAALLAVGFTESEVLSALPFLSTLEGDVMKLPHSLDALARVMTPEEHEDWRLGWPKNALARKRSGLPARAPLARVIELRPTRVIDVKEAA